jgi:general secretion pathway protein D
MKAPHILALALSIAGCDYIGPQIHTKLPLPEVKPPQEILVNTPQDPAAEESKKTIKVEIISGIEDIIPSHSHVTSSDTAHGKGEFSLNFDDADLGEVAKVILSDILGKNYTISPQVTGKVTLQTSKPLSKEELLPTLDMLLNINNAALVNQNGLYLIKPATDALYNSSVQTTSMPNGYQVRIVPIRNVAATEVAEIIRPLLPEKALLHIDPKRNILLLAGSGGELNRAMELVNIFDVNVLKGKSFALFTPAHTDAATIIDELEQIFNNHASANSNSGGNKKEKEGSSGNGSGSAASAGGESGGFYRFIEINRMNAILVITHRPQALKEIEDWVVRLDKTNTTGKGGVNVYRAQHHSAAELAHTLSNIFGTAQSSNSASVGSGRSSLSASNKFGTSGSSGSMGGSSMGSSGSSGGMSSGNSMGGGFGNSGNGGQSGMSALSNTGSTGGFGGNLSGGTSGSQAKSLMPNVKIIADESNNALIVVANPQEYAIIMKVLKQLDVLPLQVLIDATIVEVTLKNDLKYGIEWYFQHSVGGNNTNVMKGGDATLSGTDLSTIATGIATGGFSYAYSNSAHNIGGVLSAAAANNNINVISSPSLMVLNNQEADILVGDSVPVITGTTTSGLTGGTSNSIQMIDTGVSLSIKPRVNANGLVLMDLMQSVNTAVATTSLATGTSGAISTPTIQKRQIGTSVAVQSGETIVLGGLIREENDYNRNGVPFFHELPWIGPLFGGTTRNNDKTELVVLLTPRVMKSRQDAQDVTEEFKRKLTGIYDDKLRVEVEELPVEQN